MTTDFREMNQNEGRPRIVGNGDKRPISDVREESEPDDRPWIGCVLCDNTITPWCQDYGQGYVVLESEDTAHVDCEEDRP